MSLATSCLRAASAPRCTHADAPRCVWRQVNVVEEYSTGELLLQTAQAALTVIKEYQVRWCMAVQQQSLSSSQGDSSSQGASSNQGADPMRSLLDRTPARRTAWALLSGLRFSSLDLAAWQTTLMRGVTVIAWPGVWSKQL